MIRLKYIRVFLMLLLVFYSCDRNKKEAIDSIVKKWMGKEILFPENSSFITYDNRDSVDFLSMKTLIYFNLIILLYLQYIFQRIDINNRIYLTT